MNNQAKEIVSRYSRHIVNPFGEIWHIEWNGQNFSSPSKAGLIELINNQILLEK